jgi:hypothetical protein
MSSAVDSISAARLLSYEPHAHPVTETGVLVDTLCVKLCCSLRRRRPGLRKDWAPAATATSAARISMTRYDFGSILECTAGLASELSASCPRGGSKTHKRDLCW